MKTETTAELRGHVFALEMETRIIEEANEKLKKQVAGSHFAFMLTIALALESGHFGFGRLCMLVIMYLRNVKEYGDFDIVGNREALERFCDECGFDQVTTYSIRKVSRAYGRILPMVRAGASDEAIAEELRQFDNEPDPDDEGHPAE